MVNFTSKETQEYSFTHEGEFQLNGNIAKVKYQIQGAHINARAKHTKGGYLGYKALDKKNTNNETDDTSLIG